jgi:hypothetical protein
MNDPGPIMDTRAGSATIGQMITDPAYTEGYSQFCYELPFMPATTQYLDTPVVPTSAFAGAGYNNVDCAYPDATPAIASVVNTNAETSGGVTLPAGSGPWVGAAGTGHKLNITSLGDQLVPNNAYSGPSATTAPFNARTVTRHYGFGTHCTTPSATSKTCNTLSTLTIGGVAATINGWTDTAIQVTVPSGVPACTIQQQTIYGAPAAAASCGQIVITTGSGQKSIDAVTVTIGGKTPTVVTPTTPLSEYGVGSLQKAIDAAAPGDMLLLQPGTYTEMVLMWKPVRLQGVGAASVIINANTQPAGKFDPWRRQVNCLFGLALDGTPITTSHPYDPTGTYACGATGAVNFTGTKATLAYFAPGLLSDGTYNPQVDRLPLEATVGWDATLNGNLAELLQEPTLMGALEGAGITVLSKGVTFPSNPFAADTFPTGTTLVTKGTCPTKTSGTPLSSNFWCNPSRIDGISITDSSQGGGGIFVHAWGHNLEIANNRVKNNAGTLSGGINVGQGEFPPSYIVGSTTNAAPGSCAAVSNTGAVTFNGTAIAVNALEPYCHNVNVNIHNNYVSLNSSTGDELFSATPAGAGGISFCTGADNYKFNYNWVCGNLSSGDGGGLGHLGFIFNGDIEHNTFVFNQSLNPTIPANGGAMIIMGAPDVDPPCSTLTDADCVGAPNLIGPSDGVGPGLVINANLILGNAAEAGTGGGIAFQNVNGSEVITFPNTPTQWYSPLVTNNIIANNVAGWDGGGVSLEDALNINLVNNTIVSNDTTATAGVLFNALGAPLASQQGPTCTANCGTQSQPQPAGIVVIPNSAVLSANFPTTGITCPAGHYVGTTALKGTCMTAGYPELYNNLIWKNASFNIGVGALTPTYQQSVVTLYNAITGTSVATQPATDATVADGAGVIITGGTGACNNAATYWDLGVRGDTAPGQHALGISLAPKYSTLTNPSENGIGTNNLLGVDPTVQSQYCNGSRQPPEYGASGWAVPPGISDATVPNPVFNLTPVATVDEGNNWINLRWGPLTLTNPSVTGGANGNYGGGSALGNYAPATGSPVLDYITSGDPTYAAAPTTDFFGNPRKTVGTATNLPVDVGAVQHTTTATAQAFTLTPAQSTITTPQNAGVTDVITVTKLNGFTATPTLTVTGMPAGMTAAFTGTTLAVYPSFNTALGTYTLDIVGTSGALTADTTVTITVIAGKNFTLAAAPTPLTLGKGTSGTETVTVTPLNGLTTAVALTASGFPTGVTGVFTPASSLTGSNLLVTVASTAVAGTYPITITGTVPAVGTTSAAVINTTSFSLVVSTATFTLTPAPATLALRQNQGGSDVITVTDVGGFTGAVTLGVAGLPTGTTATFIGDTLTFFVGTATAIGNHAVTVTGTSGVMTASTTITLAVSAEATFTIAPAATAVPVSKAVSLLGPTNDLVTFAKVGGLDSAIALTVTGMPAGFTATFATNPLAASTATQTDNLALRASSSTPLGTYTLTITGTVAATGSSNTVTVTKTITVTVGI